MYTRLILSTEVCNLFYGRVNSKVAENSVGRLEFVIGSGCLHKQVSKHQLVTFFTQNKYEDFFVFLFGDQYFQSNFWVNFSNFKLEKIFRIDFPKSN